MHWADTLIVAAWITITPFTEHSDSTSVVLMEFSRPVGGIELFNTENYVIMLEDSSKLFEVYSIKVVEQLDCIHGTEPIILADTVLIAIITERLKPKNNYRFNAYNLKRKTGTIIPSHPNDYRQYFGGYHNNLFKLDSIKIK